jgi:hypothetical protein
LNELEIGIIRPIVHFVKECYSKREISPNCRRALLSSMHRTGLHKLEKKKYILRNVNFRSDNGQWRELCLSIIFEAIGTAITSESIREQLLHIARVCPSEVYDRLASHLRDKFQIVPAKNESFAFELSVHLLKPLPNDPKSIGVLLKFLNSLSAGDLLDPRLWLNTERVFHRFSQIPDRIVEDGPAQFVCRMGLKLTLQIWTFQMSIQSVSFNSFEILTEHFSRNSWIMA